MGKTNQGVSVRDVSGVFMELRGHEPWIVHLQHRIGHEVVLRRDRDVEGNEVQDGRMRRRGGITTGPVGVCYAGQSDIVEVGDEHAVDLTSGHTKEGGAVPTCHGMLIHRVPSPPRTEHANSMYENPEGIWSGGARVASSTADVPTASIYRNSHQSTRSHDSYSSNTNSTHSGDESDAYSGTNYGHGNSNCLCNASCGDS